MQLTLALFDDNSLTLVSDYMNPGEIVVEVGTWDEADDGSLLVTLTGQIEAGSDEVTEYEAPLEFVFTLNEDNSLSLVDEDGALFGEAGLTLYPTEATGAALDAAGEDEAADAEATPEATEEATPEPTEEASEEPTAEATEEATEEATAEATPVPTEEAAADVDETTPLTGSVTGTVPSGVYISDLLPSQDGNGTFLVTIFYEDGSILFSTYPLNGEPPITEVGSWSDNGDGTYLITATGTLDEEYDEPFEVDFTLDDDGIVTIAGVPLYPLEDINLAAAPTLVAMYQSDVITDTIEMSHTLTLVAYDDFSAELTTEYADEGEGYTEYGEWEVDESTDQLTVTLTGDDEVEYPEPIVWVFDITAEDTLVLANDEDAYYGEDGLTLFAIEMAEEEMSDAAGTDVAADTGEAAEADTETDTETADAEETPEAETSSDAADSTATIAEGIQLFQSEVLPAASSPGLQLTLGLLDDGSVALDYDYLNGEEVITNLGQWTDNGDGTLTITLTEGPSGTLELPIEFTLELDDEGNLVIIDASEESAGFLDVVLAPVVLE
jgi:hypothetical protein